MGPTFISRFICDYILWNVHGNLGEHWDNVVNIKERMSIFLLYNCFFVLMYLKYVYKMTFHILIGHYLGKLG